jgi:hypothetical protein
MNAETTLARHTTLAIDELLLEKLYKSNAHTGEQALMLAILGEAVGCFQKYHGAKDRRRRALFSAAEAWIFEPEPSDWIFSFENVCANLDLSPSYVRQGLAEWRDRPSARRSATETGGGSRTGKKAA